VPHRHSVRRETGAYDAFLSYAWDPADAAASEVSDAAVARRLRYAMQDEEHLHEIVVAETDDQVIVFGMICAPVDLPAPGHLVESPYHVYLDQPLGERVVIDAVSERPIPYFNVYDGMEERMVKMRWAS